MMPAIKDELTDLPISRQRKYQMRMARDKRCVKCGDPAPQGTLCLKHRVANREHLRKKLGLKRRYLNSATYLLESKTKYFPTS